MKKLDFNHREFTVNLWSVCRVTGWIIAISAMWTVCAVRREVIRQQGDQRTLCIAGNFQLEKVTCGAKLSKATLGVVSFLLIWHSQLHEDFSMMRQIRSVLIGLGKGQTQLEGLEGCSGLLLCLCPWLPFAAWLFHLNTKGILSWQSCKPCRGVKNQPTTSFVLRIFMSDHSAALTIITQLSSIGFM